MDASISQIAPHLFVGNVKSSLKRQVLRENNITAVVSLLDGGYNKWSHPEYRAIIPEDCHLYVPCLDSSTMDILALLEEICDFIEIQLSSNSIPQSVASTPHSVASTPSEEWDESSLQLGVETPREANVLIHCQLGVSRSATVAIAYLMRKRREGLDSVYPEVRQRRKVKPRDNFIDQLRVWEAVRYEVWEDAAKTTPKEQYRGYLARRAVRLRAKGLTGNEPIGILNY
ncbi:protein-tyrosine phosphatase-like protein [Ilyonectria robusta]|uniref:protein-tyrosine phosphatase-like protein n=1 Tax=Ilyonectria robusta TaxID=1079257 RepID=UPI001E8DD012|nr:protein-tyrosine phosphatase-like protein [Ilyonectria robusta]KAH8736927.1 protein-tyrosine phosphatase-like protein [Ilyonectria robusta]